MFQLFFLPKAQLKELASHFSRGSETKWKKAKKFLNSQKTHLLVSMNGCLMCVSLTVVFFHNKQRQDEDEEDVLEGTQYVDMLNDTSRNRMYQYEITTRPSVPVLIQHIIRCAIESVSKGATVLDIGAGSGLLSLFAAQAQAKEVFACEVYPVFIKFFFEIFIVP